MSAKTKTAGQQVLTWLHDNLGRDALAPLTGTDTRALRAAVEIIELYSYDRHSFVLAAFRLVVERMQPHTRWLAYHAIAMVMDWGDRREIWDAAGLDFTPVIGKPRCQAEPRRLLPEEAYK